MLLGTEVKAMREGRANLRDSYCRFEQGEAFLMGAHWASTATAATPPTTRCGRASFCCTGTSSASCSAR